MANSQFQNQFLKIRCIFPKKMTRDYTATTFIIHQNTCLLHLHKKLNLWLPVGGHIDPNELPHLAALREIKEETGLSVILYNPDPSLDLNDAKQLIRPVHLLLEDITPTHQHIDMIYYATTKDPAIKPVKGESTTIKWLTTQQINQLHNIPDNASALAVEAIQTLG